MDRSRRHTVTTSGGGGPDGMREAGSSFGPAGPRSRLNRRNGITCSAVLNTQKRAIPSRAATLSRTGSWMKVRIRTFIQLPVRDKVAALEGIALFWVFKTALQVIPFRRFKRLLGPAGPKDDPASRIPSGPPPPEVVTVWRRLRSMERRHPDTCLVQALTGRVMLRRRNLPSSLSFGVMEDRKSKLRFHAWLVHDDHVLSGGGAAPGVDEGVAIPIGIRLAI